MSPTTRARDYYLNGYQILELHRESPSMVRMNKVLNDLLLTPVPLQNFSWEVQGLSETLRPNVYDYDSVFLDVLFEHDLPNVLNEITDRNLVLGHIQIVRTKPGPSYIDWHRDTHFYDGEAVAGNIPPVHKIIFYPQTRNVPPEPRLKLLRGSNRTMYTEKKRDFALINELPVDIAMSSQSQCVLFETTTFHAVVPDSAPQGSIRAIYSFMSRNQFAENYGHKPIHTELLTRYEHRLREPATHKTPREFCGAEEVPCGISSMKSLGETPGLILG